MSKAVEEKKVVVKDIVAKIKNAKSFVIVDYVGITVAQDTELRKSFRDADVEYAVLKNTLVKRALHECGYKDMDQSLNGPTAVAFSNGDEVSAAKIFAECSAKFKKMNAKMGMCDGKVLDAQGVNALAAIPSRPQLLAGLASALIGTVRKLAVAINAVAEKNAQ